MIILSMVREGGAPSSEHKHQRDVGGGDEPGTEHPLPRMHMCWFSGRGSLVMQWYTTWVSPASGFLVMKVPPPPMKVPPPPMKVSARLYLCPTPAPL